MGWSVDIMEFFRWEPSFYFVFICFHSFFRIEMSRGFIKQNKTNKPKHIDISETGKFNLAFLN